MIFCLSGICTCCFACRYLWAMCPHLFYFNTLSNPAFFNSYLPIIWVKINRIKECSSYTSNYGNWRIFIIVTSSMYTIDCSFPCNLALPNLANVLCWNEALVSEICYKLKKSSLTSSGNEIWRDKNLSKLLCLVIALAKSENIHHRWPPISLLWVQPNLLLIQHKVSLYKVAQTQTRDFLLDA